MLLPLLLIPPRESLRNGNMVGVRDMRIERASQGRGKGVVMTGIQIDSVRRRGRGGKRMEERIFHHLTELRDCQRLFAMVILMLVMKRNS
jgi:hypothetical protein